VHLQDNTQHHTSDPSNSTLHHPMTTMLNHSNIPMFCSIISKTHHLRLHMAAPALQHRQDNKQLVQAPAAPAGLLWLLCCTRMSSRPATASRQLEGACTQQRLDAVISSNARHAQQAAASIAWREALVCNHYL
jgi:hypothetical protein